MIPLSSIFWLGQEGEATTYSLCPLTSEVFSPEPLSHMTQLMEAKKH